jgi:ketol-acid reductoisomerase
MSKNTNPFEDMFKSLIGENDTNDEKSFFNNLRNNPYVKDLMKDGGMNKVIDLISQMAPQLINSDALIQILDSNPNLTDELITEQINLFKKTHPKSNEIINKYLQSYEEEHSNKSIYNIRKFVKSDDCKRALNDPQVKQYLAEAINSPEIKEKLKIFK